MFQESDSTDDTAISPPSSGIVAPPTAWTVLSFGKHEGKTLPVVVMKDPDYFFWARDQGRKFFGGCYAAEANYIDYCARRIRIPDHATHGKRCIHYFVRGEELVRVDLRPVDEPPHHGTSYSIRSEVLDLSFSRSMKDYDKAGGRLLTDFLKSEVFDGKSLTKKRCHNFFDVRANFL
jgi:hypothetical protein